MKHLFTLLFFLVATIATAQDINGSMRSGDGPMDPSEVAGRNRGKFNPFANDSTKGKEVPKGIYVWTIDSRLGDITRAEVDTLPGLYPQSTLAMGRSGEYNTTGSNYTPRQSRIFVNRPEHQDYMFNQPFSQLLRPVEEFHFTNTLSPITNLSYDNCGDKTNGEDHIEARFAVNAGKRTGMGFDLNYAYARGYFQNQSTSHFGATFYVSHLGDRYQMHALFSKYHQKMGENGGLTNDDYLLHPERYTDKYSNNEIPTVLDRNWNRNNTSELFLTHRYCLGFYRTVKMSDEEIKAREFAAASRQEHEEEMKEKAKDNPDADNDNDNAIEPEPEPAPVDTLGKDMKREFVAVTSFIHTFEMMNGDHRHQAYRSPEDYYADTYYNKGPRGYTGDSICDQTKFMSIKNTLGLALLEGFNKYAKAGLKAFASHEYRRIDMPAIGADGNGFLERTTENTISLGGVLSKTQGHTFHYRLEGETWVAGADAGQLRFDFSTDLNFPLFGDTVRLEASAYMHRMKAPLMYERYHSKHLWWDKDLDSETRTRVEGTLSFDKTHTRLRVAVEELQNYTYMAMAYTNTGETRTGLTAAPKQYGSNLNVLTAQLDQQLRWGPLHWDNTITYQSSSNKDVLPLPTLNVFTNLYLLFRIAKVLRVELGASATWFTKYNAPDYLPQIGQFAIQQNSASRVELGGYPFVDAYANLHLKHARFFIMMSNATDGMGNGMAFLAPHYPQNGSTLRMGVSWNFFN